MSAILFSNFPPSPNNHALAPSVSAIWRKPALSSLLLALIFASNVMAQGDVGGSQASCAGSQNEWRQLGCYSNVSFTWMLQSSTSDVKYYPEFTGPSNMTIEICLMACRGHGFKHAALFSGTDCYCNAIFPALGPPSSGNAASGPRNPEGNDPTTQVAQINCQSPCSGNPAEYCGGSDSTEIYLDPSFPTAITVNAGTNYKYLGCYSNIYPGPMYATIATPDTPTCVQYCGELGYPYAQRSGINANTGSTCGCRTEIQAGYQIPENMCNSNCDGTTGSGGV